MSIQSVTSYPVYGRQSRAGCVRVRVGLRIPERHPEESGRGFGVVDGVGPRGHFQRGHHQVLAGAGDSRPRDSGGALLVQLQVVFGGVLDDHHEIVFEIPCRSPDRAECVVRGELWDGGEDTELWVSSIGAVSRLGTDSFTEHCHHDGFVGGDAFVITCSYVKFCKLTLV